MEIENSQKTKQNDGTNSSSINNYTKCKWAEFTNQNMQSGWMDQKNPTICCLQETHLSSKNKHRLKP